MKKLKNPFHAKRIHKLARQRSTFSSTGCFFLSPGSKQEDMYISLHGICSQKLPRYIDQFQETEPQDDSLPDRKETSSPDVFIGEREEVSRDDAKRRARRSFRDCLCNMATETAIRSRNYEGSTRNIACHRNVIPRANPSVEIPSDFVECAVRK